MKKLHTFIFLFGLINFSFAQNQTQESLINWLSIEDAVANNPENKNIFIYIYSDTCEYCEQTSNITFLDNEYAATLNEFFQPVKINAYMFETIKIKDMVFEFDQESGYHSLPVVLLEGQMNFPSFVFLNPNFELISKYSGFQENTSLMTKHLKFIGSNSHFYMGWEEYDENN